MCQQSPSSTISLLISHRNSSQPQLRHIRPGLRVPPQEPHRYMHTAPSAREPGLRVLPRNPRRCMHTEGCPPVPLTRHGHSALAGQSQRHTLPASTAQESSLRVRHSPSINGTKQQSPCEAHFRGHNAHEAGSDVPTVPLVHNIAADLSPQLVPTTDEAHPARSPCATTESAPIHAHRRLSSCASHASRSLGTRRSVPASHPPRTNGTGGQSPHAA